MQSRGVIILTAVKTRQGHSVCYFIGIGGNKAAWGLGNVENGKNSVAGGLSNCG